MDINIAYGIVGSYIFGSIKARQPLKLLNKKTEITIIDNTINDDFGGKYFL